MAQSLPIQVSDFDASPSCDPFYEAYLMGCPIDENDPGLAFWWKPRAVDTFFAVAVVTAGAPVWVNVASVEQFMQSILNHFAAVGGGSWGNMLCAPNTTNQFALVCMQLPYIERDPWFQAVAAAAVPPGTTALILASLTVITDRTNVRGQPLNKAAPPLPLISLFD